MLSIQEQLLYTTLKIECFDANKSLYSIGTGFLLSRPVGENAIKMYLVSNKHVLIGPDSIALTFTLMKDGNPELAKQYREEYERARLSEIAERDRKSKEDFERRCRDGDPHALLIREKMLRGNSSARYWELFAQCEIEEAERAGNISRLAVNGISVYEHGFADAVLESIESQGYIVMELGRKNEHK